MRRSGLSAHAPYLLTLAAAAFVWTWPLALHFRDRIPGLPGDNFSFLWNLWWMGRVLRDGSLRFFHSPYLFSPFGVDLVNHPHTALQAFLSAWLLPRLSIVEAENAYIVFSVFLNGLSAYALAFDITRQRRPSLLCGLAFGGSPFIAAHLLGHFDLLTAWVIPLFALCFRRSLLTASAQAKLGGNQKTLTVSQAGKSIAQATLCGVLMAIAAYSAYYHVVYLVLFAITYTVAWWDGVHVAVARRDDSTAAFSIRLLIVAVLAVDLAVLLWIAATGGTTIYLADRSISMRGVQNPLLVMWVGV